MDHGADVTVPRRRFLPHHNLAWTHHCDTQWLRVETPRPKALATALKLMSLFKLCCNRFLSDMLN